MGFFSRAKAKVSRAKSRVTSTVSRTISRAKAKVSRVRAKVRGKPTRTKSTPKVTRASIQSTPKRFSGPVQSGYDPQTFYTTGKSVQVQSIQTKAHEFVGAADRGVTKGSGTIIPPPRQTGVVIVTPKEQARIGDRRGSFASSTIGTPEEQFVSAADRGRYAAYTPTTTVSPFVSFFGLGLTEESRQRERIETGTTQGFADVVEQDVLAFRKDPKSFIGQTGVTSTDSSVTLTPAFFDSKFTNIRSDVFKQIKKEERDRTTSQKVLGNIKGEIAAIGSIGVHTGEFVIGTAFGELGKNVKLDSEGRRIKTKGFEFKNTFLSDTRDTPLFLPSSTTFGQKGFIKERVGPTATASGIVTVATLGVAGSSFVKQTKTLGLGGRPIGIKGALGRTGQSFTPLSFKEGQFTQKIIPSTKDKASLGTAFFDEGTTFTRRGKGSLGDVEVDILQTGKIGKGGKETNIFTQTTTTAPALRIGPGGTTKLGGVGSLTGSKGRGGFLGDAFKEVGGIKIKPASGKPGSSFTDTISREEFNLAVFEGKGGRLSGEVNIAPFRGIKSKSAGIQRDSGIPGIEGLSTFSTGPRSGKFGKPRFDEINGVPLTSFKTESSRFKPFLRGTEINVKKFKIDPSKFPEEIIDFGSIGGKGKGIRTGRKKVRKESDDLDIGSGDLDIGSGDITLQLKQEKPLTKGQLDAATATLDALNIQATKPTPKVSTTKSALFGGVPASTFQGKGIFERTSGGLVPGQQVGSIFVPTTRARIKEVETTGFFQPTKTTTVSGGRTRDITGLGLGGAFAQPTVVRDKQRTGLGIALGQPQASRQVTPQRSRFGTIFGGALGRGFVPLVPTTRVPFPTGILFPFALPIADTSLKRRRKPKKKRKAPRREASLAAIGLGITSPTLFRGERTSLGIRPILIDPRKKKKKKKGGKK